MKCVHSRREVRHTFQFRNDDHIMTFGSVLCIQSMKRVTMYFKHTTCPCLVIQLIVMWTCANDNNHYNLLRFCCCFYSPHAPLSLFGFPTSLSLLHPQMQGYIICHETLLVKQQSRLEVLYVGFVRNGCSQIL